MILALIEDVVFSLTYCMVVFWKGKLGYYHAYSRLSDTMVVVVQNSMKLMRNTEFSS